MCFGIQDSLHQNPAPLNPQQAVSNMVGYWTIQGQINSRSVDTRTGLFIRNCGFLTQILSD